MNFQEEAIKYFSDRSVESYFVSVLQINMTHLIRHLSFGRDYPSIVNPLDGTDVAAPQGWLTLPKKQPQIHTKEFEITAFI